jgi:hypothetical protein
LARPLRVEGAITTRLHEVYRALGLAYKKMGESEAWNVIYERLLALTRLIEDFDWKLYSLGLKPPRILKDMLLDLSRVIESGEESEAYRKFEEIAQATVRLWRLVRALHVHIMLLRLTRLL